MVLTIWTMAGSGLSAVAGKTTGTQPSTTTVLSGKERQTTCLRVETIGRSATRAPPTNIPTAPWETWPWAMPMDQKKSEKRPCRSDRASPTSTIFRSRPLLRISFSRIPKARPPMESGRTEKTNTRYAADTARWPPTTWRIRACRSPRVKDTWSITILRRRSFPTGHHSTIRTARPG